MTALITSIHLGLLIAGFSLAGARPVLFILAASMVGSWIAGAYLGGPERIVAFIMLDLFVIFAVSVWRDRHRDRLVGLISLILIAWGTGYSALSYMDYHSYAVGVNCAAVVQLLIGGGMADDLGRRIDNWLDSVWPWGARIVRAVAV